MSNHVIPHHPNNQSIVVAALLDDLLAVGWRLVSVSQDKLDGRVFEFSTHPEALEIIQGLEIAVLEFNKAQRTNQSIRLDYGCGVGREMLSDWNRLPEFDALIEEFRAGIDARLLKLFPDTQLNVDQIKAKYEAQGEHPQCVKADWMAEVANGDTLRGYWEWVQAKVEEKAVDGVVA